MKIYKLEPMGLYSELYVTPHIILIQHRVSSLGSMYRNSMSRTNHEPFICHCWMCPVRSVFSEFFNKYIVNFVHLGLCPSLRNQVPYLYKHDLFIYFVNNNNMRIKWWKLDKWSAEYRWIGMLVSTVKAIQFMTIVFP